MRRRRAAAVAGAAAVTAFAAVAAVGANLGLFELAQPDPGAGDLAPIRAVSVAPPVDALPIPPPATTADD